MVRLANRQRTEVALAGLRLAPDGRPVRMCVTFALPPEPGGEHRVRPAPPTALARATEARMRAGLSCEMGLLEIDGSIAEAVGPALEALAPDSLASEIAPAGSACWGPTPPASDLVQDRRVAGSRAAGPGRHRHRVLAPAFARLAMG